VSITPVGHLSQAVDAWPQKKKRRSTVLGDGAAPVSQMASLSFLPPMLTIFTLKSTPVAESYRG